MFKQSNLLDCTISAYPFPVPEVNGINQQIPNFFDCDLDRKIFRTDKLFRQALQRTLQNFDTKLHGAKPTVIFSGGYHIPQSLDADIVLEEQPIFKEFDEPSRKLMQYAETLMTDNLCDPSHNYSVSFSNSMIRIPGSYNSKYIPKDANGDPILSSTSLESKVRVVQLSNGFKPNIRYLLEGLWESLIQERNNEIANRSLQQQRRIRFEIRYGRPTYYRSNRIDWIEWLLEKPLDDYRKFSITFILVPYLINIKR